MAQVDVPDTSWQARIKEGVVQYNSLAAPQLMAARRTLTGLDGGDLTLWLAQGHRPLAVDGGDLADPVWQWSRSPLNADGGVLG